MGNEGVVNTYCLPERCQYPDRPATELAEQPLGPLVLQMGIGGWVKTTARTERGQFPTSQPT